MAVNNHDKYFTPKDVVEKTLQKVYDLIGIDNVHSFIEPGAGDGAFIEALKKTGKPYRLFDLYPEHPEIEQADFLKLQGERIKGRVIIGNPPYGSASSLFKKFAKKGAELGDWIIFVSPASQYNSNYYLPMLELVDSEHLGDVEYYGSEEYGGKPVKVRTCINTYRVKGEERNEVEDREARVLEDFEIRTIKLIEDGKRIEPDKNSFAIFSYARTPYVGAKIEKYPDIKLGTGFLIKCKKERDINKMSLFLDDFLKNNEEEIIQLYKSKNYGSIGIRVPFLIEKIYEEFYAPKTKEQRVLEDFEIGNVAKKNGRYLPENYKEKYDFFILKWGARMGEMDNEPNRCLYFGIKCLNRSLFEKAKAFFEGFYIKYNGEGKKRTDALYIMQSNFLIEKIYEEFYAPKTKEQRVLEDFEIDTRDHKGQEKKQYDFYLANMATKGVCKFLEDKDEYVVRVGIRCKNDKMKERAEAFFRGFYRFHDEVKEKAEGPPLINKPFLIEKIYEEFYAPKTKEQRVLEDFEIRTSKKRGNPTYDYNDGDFYLCSFGAIGEFHYDNERIYEKYTSIKVKNKSLYEKTRLFCEGFREKYRDEIMNKSAGTIGFTNPFLIDKIYEEFYAHEDQQTPEDKTPYFPPEYGDNEELWIAEDKKKIVAEALF
jgi:hypothetical protein